MPSRGPAYRIETERLALRCWSPADAPLVRACLDRSDAHLRPFIPFMRAEPRSLEGTAAWLRGHRADFDRDRHFRYAVFDAAEARLLGEVMLLDRAGTGDRELGYWLDVNAIGCGYATEASAALIRLAFEVDAVDRVELCCEPENRPSIALAERLGFTHEATLKRRATDPAGRPVDLMIWTLFADAYPASLARQAGLRAFDCLGRTLL